MGNMSKLIFVKHSAPEIVPSLPARLWHLSEVGRSRGDTLARKLEAYKPDVIISSAEPKAVETAQIIADRLRLQVEIAEGLHEHERENVGFLSSEEFEASIARFFGNPGDLVFGQETAGQALERFAGAVASVLDAHPGGNVVIVAHGTVITLFVAGAAGLEPFPFWKSLGLPSFVVLTLPELDLVTVVEDAGE
jgi:broad specificity phosphatase PhoE